MPLLFNSIHIQHGVKLSEISLLFSSLHIQHGVKVSEIPLLFSSLHIQHGVKVSLKFPSSLVHLIYSMVSKSEGDSPPL